MGKKPRLIGARAFSIEQGLDYGYIMRQIKKGLLKCEIHGKRYKIDRDVAQKWLKEKQYVAI